MKDTRNSVVEEVDEENYLLCYMRLTERLICFISKAKAGAGLEALAVSIFRSHRPVNRKELSTYLCFAVYHGVTVFGDVH